MSQVEDSFENTTRRILVFVSNKKRKKGREKKGEKEEEGKEGWKSLLLWRN